MALNQNAQYAYRYLQEKYNLTPEQAAGVIGNLMQESSLRTSAINPGDGNDGSNSVGIAQWNGDRARDLHAFAKANDRNVGDLDTQLDFMMHELQSKETAAWNNLQKADDVKEATAAMIGYERPQGWKADNPTGGHAWTNRLKYAGQIYGMSPEDIAKAQATNSAPPIETAQAEVPKQPEEANKNPVKNVMKAIVPETIAGQNTSDISSGLTKLGAALQPKDSAQPQFLKGGLLGGGSANLQYDPTRNMQAIIPSAGLLGQGTKPGGLTSAEFERRKRLAALKGGLGGLGGLGNFV